MNSKTLKLFCATCFVVYLLLLTKLIVFKYPDSMMSEIARTWSVDAFARHLQTANFIPFKTIGSSLFNTQLSVEIPTLVYNMAAFLPEGFLLPCITAKSLRGALIARLIVSAALELIQLVTLLGSADVDDVILNITGTAIGYGAYRLAAVGYQRIDIRSKG
jgi:glycopeptide antibiotics resistance protein